jgi:hypothetical protein
MPEHTMTTTPDAALTSPVGDPDRKPRAEPVSRDEHAASLSYEHVHRIEITLTLLTGIVGRIRKPGGATAALDRRCT